MKNMKTSAFASLSFLFVVGCVGQDPNPIDNSGAGASESNPAVPPAASSGTKTPPEAARQTESSTTFAPSIKAPFFVDHFDRTDGPVVNDWFVKTPGMFVISGGKVAQTAYIGNYTDSLALRPESSLDVEISSLVAYSDECCPWVLLTTRAQPDADLPNAITAYRAVLNPGLIRVERTGAAPTEITLGQLVLPIHLAVGENYRLTLRVTGTDVVTVEGDVQKADGTEMGYVKATDEAPARIVKPGRSGFGGGGPGSTWDDFQITNL